MWILNILDQRGHYGDVEFGDKLSDSDTFGPYDDIDEAIDEWLQHCKELHEDVVYIHESIVNPHDIEGECTGGIMHGTIVLEFAIYGVPNSGEYRLFGEIFSKSSDNNEPEPDFEWLRRKVYKATDYNDDLDI